jgi:hypothetical protein
MDLMAPHWYLIWLIPLCIAIVGAATWIGVTIYEWHWTRTRRRWKRNIPL